MKTLVLRDRPAPRLRRVRCGGPPGHADHGRPRRERSRPSRIPESVALPDRGRGVPLPPRLHRTGRGRRGGRVGVRQAGRPGPGPRRCPPRSSRSGPSSPSRTSFLAEDEHPRVHRAAPALPRPHARAARRGRRGTAMRSGSKAGRPRPSRSETYTRAAVRRRARRPSPSSSSTPGITRRRNSARSAGGSTRSNVPESARSWTMPTARPAATAARRCGGSARPWKRPPS